MNNQAQMNSIASLEEASRVISDLLIKEKYKLEQERKQLFEYKKIYEKAYIEANDGDASENAPLEAAIQNLKRMTGEIGNNARVLQNMRMIEDVQYLIGTYDFSDIAVQLQIASEALKEIFCNEAGLGNYNAVLSMDEDDLVEKIGTSLRSKSVNEIYNICYSIGETAKELGHKQADIDLVRVIVDYISVAGKPNYNTSGIIVPYSTVRLKLNGETMTYRLYPEGVSFIDIGVMAGNARVARAILGKKVGDVVGVRHDSRNIMLEYKIEDIY